MSTDSHPHLPALYIFGFRGAANQKKVIAKVAELKHLITAKKQPETQCERVPSKTFVNLSTEVTTYHRVLNTLDGYLGNRRLECLLATSCQRQRSAQQAWTQLESPS